MRQYAGVFDPGFYMDADGKGGTGGGTIQLRMRYEDAAPYAGSTGGEADEGAVFCVLWDLLDRADTNDKSPGVDDDALDGSVTFAGQSGDVAHWQTFTGPVKSASNLTIRNLWDGWFTPVNHGNQSQMEVIFGNFKMRFFEDSNDPNQTAATATPDSQTARATASLPESKCRVALEARTTESIRPVSPSPRRTSRHGVAAAPVAYQGRLDYPAAGENPKHPPGFWI